VADVLRGLAASEGERAPGARPFVTLAYAQSLDGCIAAQPGRPTALSGAASLRLTHALRARHDAILVGIGTLLADDPRLDVRLVEGRSPRPIIVDSRLSCPATARLFRLGGQRALIASTERLDERRKADLQAQGVEIWPLPAWANGWVDLAALLDRLAASGVRRLMVEGGARVLTSFLRAGLVDYAVVTQAPRWLGGLPAIDPDVVWDAGAPPAMAHVDVHRFGDDVVFAGPMVKDTP